SGPSTSFSVATVSRCSSAPTRIVRNFTISKVEPPRPRRGWRNNAGPGLSSRIATAISARNGASRTSAMLVVATSNDRLSSLEAVLRVCAELALDALRLRAAADHEGAPRPHHAREDPATDCPAHERHERRRGEQEDRRLERARDPPT